jgi:hypothetical protein
MVAEPPGGSATKPLIVFIAFPVIPVPVLNIM